MGGTAPGNSPYVFVGSNGNVGIGTTAPTAMFAVGSSSQFNVTSSGGVSIASDLSFTNGTAAHVNFGGPGYIRTNHPSGNYDLTLSAGNSGVVYIDDAITVAKKCATFNRCNI